MTPHAPTPPRPAWPWVMVLLAVALACYSGVWNLGWTGWDDTAYVVNNPHMTASDGLRRIWTTGESEQYYPLSFTLYWLEYRLFGPAPGGYHAVSLLLHACNGVLVLALLRRLGASPWAGVPAAAIFLAHPVQVISVAWIAEQKNLLATACMLASVLAWMRGAATPGARRWYLLSLGAFVLAMLSKTVVIGLPLALLVLDTGAPGRRWGRALLRIAPMLAIAAALAALTILFERKFIDTRAEGWMPALPERLQIAAAAPWAYLGRLLWPAGLSPAYELWNVDRASLRWWLPALASLGAAIAWLVAWRRRAAPPAVWGLAQFALLLGPTLGVMAFANLAVTHTSDHFLYPALPGLLAALAWGVDAVPARSGALRRALPLALAFGALACIVITRRDLPVYRDAESLWARAVAVAPGNYTAHMGYAEGLRNAGKAREATAEYRRAIELRPGWIDAYMFLGDAQRDAGDDPAAEATYRKALSLWPDNPVILSHLAAVLERRRALDEAFAMYQRAVALDPGLVEARMGLASMHLGYARFPEALEQFRAVLGVRDDHAMAHLGVVTCLQRLGRDAEAAAAAREATRRVPGSLPLWNMLARVLGTSPDPAVRDGAAALAAARRADELAGGSNYQVLDTLAVALAAKGDFAEAARVARRAADLAHGAGDDRFAGLMLQFEQAYAAGRRPWDAPAP